MAVDIRNGGMWDSRVKPASIEYAAAVYPQVVDGLIHQRYTIFLGPANAERRLVTLAGPTGYVSMLRDDYDILQSIAASLEPQPVFQSEPKQDFLQRIQAIIRVRFRSRSPF